MKPLINSDISSKEHFYKITVVGGGITGAIMVLLLKNSNLFDTKEIMWIRPKNTASNDLRTTFYNHSSFKLLSRLNILNKLKKADYSEVKEIKVFGKKNTSPLIWSSDGKSPLGTIIRNNIILDSIIKELSDIKQSDSLVTNTTCDEFERTLYLKNKQSIKTHLVISADGKNSRIRELLSIKTISRQTNHTAISGFLKVSENHNLTAIQAFTKLGPVGLLPYDNKNIINFVFSVEKNRCKRIFKNNHPEIYLCNELNDFFFNIKLKFEPLNKISGVKSNISTWPLDLKFILDPTSERTILIGDAAHAIHPLAGQGLNLAIQDCVSTLTSIERSLKFGNDLGDTSILNNYKKQRLPKTTAMTAMTDFLFYGFTIDSYISETLLTKGMTALNKSNIKNIFKKIAAT